MLFMISFQRVSSHSVSSCVRETMELNFTTLFLRSHASESTVYLSVHRASVLVYQLLLTLFSYSFGPVTPSITYWFFSSDQLHRWAQKREMAMRTSRPYLARYAWSVSYTHLTLPTN